jgi:hypothetical protein
MHESILMPLDKSPFSEQGLPYGSRISLGLGIPIQPMQVLHTVSEELADPADGLCKNKVTEGVQDEAMDYLNSVERRTPGSDVTCETFEGNVISQIIEEAENPLQL